MKENKKNNFTKQTFAHYLKHALKYRVAFSVILLLVVFASVANVIAPLYYKKFFDLLTQTG